MKDGLGKHLLAWRIRVVLPHLEGDVLDVGCGTNDLLAAYREDHPDRRAVGADVHPWDGVDLLMSDASEIPVEDDSFDTVCCIAALNHIPNREAFLDEARRILRPDGRLLLTMIPPIISRAWHFLRAPWDADQHERGMVEGEVFGLTPARVRALLRDHGFEVRSEKRFMLGVNRLYAAAPITRPESACQERRAG